MTTVILLVLGAIVGSFLNVIALRWDSPDLMEALSMRGRSQCPSCHKKLRWWELIPILSFVVLRARCSGCKKAISWQYPIIELWTAIVFASLCGLGLTFAVYTLMLVVFCIYTVILVYDWHHTIIPDVLVYTSMVLSLLVRVMSGNTLLDWLAGPIIFSFFGLIWLVSRGRAMGFGDAKLGLSIGLLLGATNGFSAIIISFWIGTVFSLLLMCFRKIGFIKNGKELTMKSEIPFAPFMILGAFLSLITHLNLFYVGIL